MLLALFVATLATLIVSALFYRQFVLLRTIENQQLMAQSRLLLRGAHSTGGARSCAKMPTARATTRCPSPGRSRWPKPGSTSSARPRHSPRMASIAGSMEDAQSRYNLRNLVENGQIVESELEALRRLCGLLQVAEQTADLIAQRMQEALPGHSAG